jgi:hypothetical protein
MKSSKFTSILILIGFVFLITTYGQQKDRLITYNQFAKWEPLKIVQMKIKDKPVKFGEYLVEDDDWLKGFSIELENTSDLPINYLEIELSIPKTPNKMPNNATERMKYGVYPPPPGMPPRVKPSQPPLQPGERVTLSVNYESLQRLLNFAGHQGSVVHVIVRSATAIFPHEIKWYKGGIFRPDPKDPRRWVQCHRNSADKLRC